MDFCDYKETFWNQWISLVFFIRRLVNNSQLVTAVTRKLKLKFITDSDVKLCIKQWFSLDNVLIVWSNCDIKSVTAITLVSFKERISGLVFSYTTNGISCFDFFGFLVQFSLDSIDPQFFIWYSLNRSHNSFSVAVVVFLVAETVVLYFYYFSWVYTTLLCSRCMRFLFSFSHIIDVTFLSFLIITCSGFLFFLGWLLFHGLLPDQILLTKGNWI